MRCKPDFQSDLAVNEATSDNYNTGVLVGNWYENRFSDKTDKRAITPCIYGVSTCDLGRTNYADNYKAPVTLDSTEDILEFMDCRHTAFENSMKGKTSSIKFKDNDQFMRNMTTMKDILFRIKPQEVRGYGEFDILKPRLKDNFLKSYGNSTVTGLNAWIKCQALREARQRIDISTYKATYTPKFN